MRPFRIRVAVLAGLLVGAVLVAGTAAGGRAGAGAERDGSDTGGVTVVFLVRHAEKDTTGNDPGLTSRGRARAEALAVLLAPAGLHAIYSTPFRRTLETAGPLAGRLGLAVETLLLDPKNLAAHAADTARLLRETHGGGTVLVVGHSNTVPEILGALGVADPPAIADQDYGDLFEVVLAPRAPARLVRLRFGDGA